MIFTSYDSISESLEKICKSIDEYFKSADYSGFLKEIDRKRNNYISFLKANGIEINDIDSCIIEK